MSLIILFAIGLALGGGTRDIFGTILCTIGMVILWFGWQIFG